MLASEWRPDPLAKDPGASNSTGSGRSTRGPRTLRLVLVIPALALVGGLLAACSSGTNAGSKSTTSTTAKGAASFQAYLTCLKNHGVNLPAGGRGGGGPPGTGGGPPGSFNPGSTGSSIPSSASAAFQKAQQACASLRPSFGGGGNPGNSTAFAAYRNCLKLHGVTLPARPGGFGGGTPSSSTTPTTETSKEKAAEAACASLRPKGFGGRPPSSTTTTS
jgi:hypothetical protein